MDRDNRFHELDVLRGLAAFAVVLSHQVLGFGRDPGFHDLDGWFDWVGPAEFYYAGRLPVVMFFMLSGFVIHRALDRCASFPEFAFARVTRLYPVYWVGVALTATVLWFDLAGTGGARPEPARILANVTMVQHHIGYASLDPVYWTLLYEMRFYLALGLIHFSPLRRLLLPILAIWLAAALGNALLTDTSDRLTLTERIFNLPYAHFFAAGVAFSLFVGRASRLGFTLIVASAMIVALYWPPVPALIALCFWPIFWLAISGRLRALDQPVLRWLGAISYPLYLVHQPIGFALGHRLNDTGTPALVTMATTIAASLVVAHLVMRWIERPTMGWARRVRTHKRR